MPFTATDEQLALLGLILSSVIVVSVLSRPIIQQRHRVRQRVAYRDRRGLIFISILVKALLRVGFAFAAKVIVLEGSTAVGISVDFTEAVFLKVPASFSVWVIV